MLIVLVMRLHEIACGVVVSWARRQLLPEPRAKIPGSAIRWNLSGRASCSHLTSFWSDRTELDCLIERRRSLVERKMKLPVLYPPLKDGCHRPHGWLQTSNDVLVTKCDDFNARGLNLRHRTSVKSRLCLNPFRDRGGSGMKWF